MTLTRKPIIGEGLKPTKLQNKKSMAKKLFDMLLYLAKKECLIEQNRVKLARMDNFEPRQAF